MKNLVFSFILSMALPVWADTVIVESRSGGKNFAKYSENTGQVFPNVWANSTAKSTAPDTTAGIGSRFNSNAGLGGATTWFQVNPTLGTAGGTYEVYVTVSATSAGAAVVSTITQTGCTGLPATTDAFSVGSLNVWTLVGTITLDTGVNNPTIRFDETQNDNRFYADAVKFVLAGEPCLGVPQLSTVNGPLAAGQTFVDVPAITNGVTNVTVYTSTGTKLGELTSGVVEGVNRVTTIALVKGDQIVATQWKDGIESCKATSGPKVGGGANPSVKVVFNIRENTDLTGPVGADGGTTNGPNFFLGSANKTGGFGSAPSGGTVITPSGCWQTVTFQRGDDPVNPINPTYRWDVTTPDTLDGDYGILDSIGFAIQDTTDTGPFAIYIDTIINGNTVIQDFESATNGQPTVMFSLPSANTAANTLANLLSQPPGSITPNVSMVVSTNAFSGSNSCFVSWQFNTSLNTVWEQLLTRGSSTPNPIVDLRLPISIRLLVLPVGQITNKLSLTSIPQSQSKSLGQSATFNVTASGVAPFSYQWKHEGTNIPSATGSSYTIPSVIESDAGAYTVVVTNAACTTLSPTALLTIGQTAPALTISRSGPDVTLTWAGTYNLQSKTNLSDPTWNNVGVSTSPYVIPATNSATFYRLQGP